MKPAVMTDAEATALLGRRPASTARSPAPAFSRGGGTGRAGPVPVLLARDVARMLTPNEGTVSRLVAKEPRLAGCRTFAGRPVFTVADFHQFALRVRRRA